MSIEQLKVEIDMGFRAEAFLESPLGRFLEARAQADAEQAMSELAEHDPEDAKGIRALQAKIAVARQWRQWIEEAVHQGEQAQAALAEEMDGRQ